MSATLVEVSSILVVDDHRVFGELLAHRLRRDAAIDDARVACTVEQARAALVECSPDVVLLDADLEGASGLELVTDLRRLGTNPRVVVLADADQEPLSALGLDPEECGWVSKESSFEHLLETIEAVRRGRLPRPATGEGTPDRGPSVPTAPVDRLTPEVPAPREGDADDGRGPTPGLTPRQAEVLQCLVTGMTRAEVAVRLGLSPHTVRDHVRHLFRIAAVTSTADLKSWATADGGTRPRRLRVVPGP